MNVTQKNFEAFYHEFKEYLPKAEFYSMDLEMTGIKAHESEMVSDLPYEKYLKVNQNKANQIKCKIRSAANKYRIIQVGLCLFIRTGENEFEVRPYNIYVFPRESFGFSPQINMDSSAVDFNTRHGMDWNKWFSEGISYMTLKEANKRKEELNKAEAEAEFDPNNVIKLTKEEDIQRSQDFIKKLDAWSIEDTQEPLMVDEQSRFFRKHLYETLKKDYPHLVYETICKGDKPNEKEIKIIKFANEEEKAAYFEKKKKDKEEFLRNKMGFTAVIELLVDSKKPIVGHNCYLDLLFIYSHFIEYLPYNYENFKKNLNKHFPEIYDTKFIVHNSKFQSKISLTSTLDILTDVCITSQDPDFYDFKIKLEGEFKAYEIGGQENSRYHEAGYDAFLTGFIFAKMFYALSKEEQLMAKNSVNTMRSLYYLKSGEEDLMYKKCLIYVLQSKEKNVKVTSDFLNIFEEEKIQESIRFVSLSQTGFTGAMLICDPKSENEREAIYEVFEKKILNHNEPGITVLKYNDYCKIRREKYEKEERSY